MRRRIQMFGVSGIAATLLVSLTWAALQYGPAAARGAEVLAWHRSRVQPQKHLYEVPHANGAAR